MSNPIEELTALVDAFRAETEVESITPERLGALLQRMIDELPNILGIDKVNKSDIADNLSTDNNAKVLSARQGVLIKALIDALNTFKDTTQPAVDAAQNLRLTALENSKVNMSDIADNTDTDDATKVLSAKQGKFLRGLIDALITFKDTTQPAVDAAQDLRLTYLEGAVENIMCSVPSGLPDVTITIKFKLTQSYTNIVSSVSDTSVAKGSILSVSLTPDEGYEIGTIIVTMGDEDITSTAYSNNVVNISEVTGDVSIVAYGIEAGVQPIQFADPVVEAICLDNWDTDHKGFLTQEDLASVTTIGTIFKGNTQITSFDELSLFGVTSLNAEAFRGCTSLASIDVSKINSMGQGCFRECSSLTKFKTNNTINAVSNSCFRTCTGLVTLDLGNSVVSLGSAAMYGATLSKLIFRSSTPPTYESSYVKNNVTLYVPDDAFSAYQSDANWGSAYPENVDSNGKQMKRLSDYVES